jgi:DNA sulfur modification protein DndB
MGAVHPLPCRNNFIATTSVVKRSLTTRDGADVRGLERRGVGPGAVRVHDVVSHRISVILSKRLANEIPLFHERINMTSNSSAPKSPYVIALNTLVTANTELLAAMLKTSPKAVTKHPDMSKLRGAQPADDLVTSYANHLSEVWKIVVEAIPQWQGVIEKKVKPGELRGDDGFVFAFGLGWQAIALVAPALITHRRGTWKTDLAKAIQAVDWKKGPHWNGIAMIGDRVNNRGPGVKATAGYVLENAGFTEKDGTDIKDLLVSLEGSRVTKTAA